MQVIITANEYAAGLKLGTAVASAIGTEYARNFNQVMRQAKVILSFIADPECTDMRKAELIEEFNKDYTFKEGIVSVYMNASGDIVMDYKEEAILETMAVFEEEVDFFASAGTMIFGFLKTAKTRLTSIVKRIEKIESSHAHKAE